jgi:hypothetical protein
MGTLNSRLEFDVASNGLSNDCMAAFNNDADGGRDGPVLELDTDDDEKIERVVRELEEDDVENNEGEGEILGRVMDGVVGTASVIGNPRSFRAFKVFVKSESLRNFN